jgi:hypothetical protein
MGRLQVMFLTLAVMALVIIGVLMFGENEHADRLDEACRSAEHSGVDIDC